MWRAPSSRHTRRRPDRICGMSGLVIVALVMALLASSCGLMSGSDSTDRHGALAARGDSPTTTPSTDAPSTTTTVPGPPVTPVQWTPCGDLQCGSVTVPLDYSRPNGPTIQIAVARHPAEVPADRIGSLVINPGGPGVSGIDDLPSELSVLTPGLLDDFDIVSFDPRGVQRSDPVTCGSGGSPSSNTSPLPDPTPTSKATEEALVSNDQSYAKQCESDSASILPYVGTVDTAMDLDRIRAALGDATLTYIGHSYGTLLGATYAQMFPTHVRAMVLDGAIDPALSAQDTVIQQADSFEGALNNFFSWCQGSSSCGWNPSGDPTSALLALINQARQSPISDGSGRSAGPGEIYNALLDGLYSPEDWPTLGQALAEAAGGDSAAVLTMSDSYRQDGSTNGSDAAEAIWCLDHPVPRDVSDYSSIAATAAASAPVFGPLLAWGLLGCAVWSVPPTRVPAPTTASGAPPILVTGATSDPATPYQWAVNLSHELQKGYLLTWQGDSHVAYYYSSCVRAVDQTYLISLTLPAPGMVCT
jgi:pimeloyl-ACP methyl ester carboxylesterase